MLNLLKKLFIKEQIVTKEINLSNLQNWFEQETTNHKFNDYIINYSQKIQEIKNTTQQKVIELENQQISNKDKNVEGRIQNIVIGHKDNYAKEILRFLDYLNPNISSFQEAIEYNNKLNQNIEELAKKTQKSYQASQHLFFDNVEAIFKQLGELNILVKEFNKEVFKENISNIQNIQNLINELNEEKVHKLNYLELIKINNQKSIKLKQEIQEMKNSLKNIEDSNELKNYNKLNSNLKELERKKDLLDNEVHSYFSKLNKPLRKYQRIALDDKPIVPYLENTLKAFENDKELNIIEGLEGLRNNLDKLGFDEKQQTVFSNLIKKSLLGYLQELQQKQQQLINEKENIQNQLNNNSIINKIEEIKSQINISERNLTETTHNSEKLNTKLEKINEDKIKETIIKSVKDTFKVKLTLTSSLSSPSS